MAITFNDLIADAHRAVVSMDRFTKRDGPEETAAAITRAKLVYGRLLEHLYTSPMTKAEASSLQDAIDLLKARLKYFGEQV